ncbi:MAG: DUF2304 family protein [Planctomycetales bacterium]|nr:DUF2304 family protein [Planctomycetales bacterium]NIM07948.1 DUF2304 family protein [Planctomycetales bacterium]NIN07427.1 DUF2304 family protein [Planctomycetales bacterium]NIN76531.1 DUF2304 family protein [Planctomycetales bacterium]NIO33721.1 DUF2304 family protein [Planctomycetales bacterium]
MNSLNLFQWLALSGILGLLIIELVSAIRGRVVRTFWVVRVVIWIATGIAIYHPALTTGVATRIGIERGTDLLLYLTVLTFFGTSLFLYARCLRLQQQITRIVRHLALEESEPPQ